MLKKSICIMLVPSILINSLGCSSRTTILAKSNIDSLNEGDTVIIIMRDRKEHDIMVERIEEKEIHGVEYIGRRKSQVVIQIEDISEIHLKESDSKIGSGVMYILIAAGIAAGIVIVAIAPLISRR